MELTRVIPFFFFSASTEIKYLRGNDAFFLLRSFESFKSMIGWTSRQEGAHSKEGMMEWRDLPQGSVKKREQKGLGEDIGPMAILTIIHFLSLGPTPPRVSTTF